MYVHIYKGHEYKGMAYVSTNQKRKLETNGYTVVVTTGPRH